MAEKYKTCVHAVNAGEIAVYVTTGCPRATLIKGTLVSSKHRCKGCRSWKGREK